MKKVLLFLTFALTCFTWGAKGQKLSDYTLTVSHETYTSIATTENRLTGVYGDFFSQSVTLPFIFAFGDSSFTSVSVRVDGYLYFGSTASQHVYKAWSDWSDSSFRVIVPIFADDGKLTSNGTTSGAYATTVYDGEDPVMFVVEFKGLTSNSGTGTYNFQVRLYPNGNISAVYGANTLCTSANNNYFLANGSDHICLTGSYALPVAGTPVSLPNFTTAPAEGQVITYVRPTCVKPHNLQATLTPGNGTATLNWTAGGTETNWVLEYGTAFDFIIGATSVDVSGTPTQDLTDLTAETKYYARVKADCGGGDVSEWSNVVDFTPTNYVDYTFGETSSSTEPYVPFYGYFANYGTLSQFIIPVIIDDIISFL